MRLINAEGEQVGVVSISEAKQIAEDSEIRSWLKLYPIQNHLYVGSWITENSFSSRIRKSTLLKRSKSRYTIKEVKFRPGTEDGDYQNKVKEFNKILEQW